MKYAAYRYADSGTYANVMYFFDGGSLATLEKAKVTGENGEEVNRECWLARVGEHHNSPAYDGYNMTNTNMCVPMDMNVFDACLPELMRLQDIGRMVIGVVPTASFGLLHAELKLPSPINQNDTLHVVFPGKNEPLNGKKLVVVGWGPDCKMIAKTLVAEKINCELFILNYMEPANSLIRYLDELAQKGIATEVLCVDPNQKSAFIGPVITQMKKALGYPQDLVFTDCTIDDHFVPYGLGDGLLNASDLVRALKERGVLESSESVAKRMYDAPVEELAPKAAPKKASPGAAAGAKEKVMAPLEGEVQVTKVHKQKGDHVEADELIAEIESDKATVEVTSPIDGVLEELFMTEGQTMELTEDTHLCTVAAEAAEPAVGKVEYKESESVVVAAPFKSKGAELTWHKRAGDKVNGGEVMVTIHAPEMSGEDNVKGGTVDIASPFTGTLVEIFLDNGVTDLTPNSKIFAVVRAGEGKTMLDSDMTDDHGRVVGSSMWLPENMEEMAQLTPEMQAKALEALNKSKPGMVSVQAAEEEKAEEVVQLSRHHQAMVNNMTVQPGDTRVFVVSENVDFKKVAANSKAKGVTPVTSLVKSIADTLAETKSNMKLSDDKKSMRKIKQVDIGVAVDVEGQLRVAVIRDVANKSLEDIQMDIKNFAAKGPKLSVADQNLTNVCWVVSSMGKDASQSVVAVLPRECAGILAVGRMDSTGNSALAATVCHATYSGLEGARVLRGMCTKLLE